MAEHTPVTDKPKLSRCLTMASYSWHNFAREFAHYDLADSMHLLCPPRKWLKGIELGGFAVNITPQVPFPEITQATLYDRWHEQLSELRRLGKPFDFWGIFEGEKNLAGPGYTMGQCQLPPEEYDRLMAEVGDLFLGWELGEWDGLYGRDVVYYWRPEEYPSTRREAHDRLVGWLSDLHRRLYSNANCLCGVTLAHYFEELPVRMLGAEIGQGLLNTQVYVAFLRGACRQYDLQYKLLASVFDRWGYRCYTDSPDVTLENETGLGVWKAGPHQGHSIGLLKALWLSGFLAGAAIVGLDGGYYTDELEGGVRKLSPLGEAFQAFTDWVRTDPARGKQVRPLALLLDYYAGWAPPRHLYTFTERVVWHCLPYGPADHAMDQAFDLFYPDYGQAGYYHDERGFLTATPLGEAADVLLSDASIEALAAYPVVWLLSDEQPDDAFAARLQAYSEGGGHLIAGGPAGRALSESWFGTGFPGEPVQASVASVRETAEEVREAFYSVWPVEPGEGWEVWTETEAGLPLIASHALGEGRFTLLTADHGLTNELTAPGFDMNHNLDFTPDPPFELLHVVQRYIRQVVQEQMPVRLAGEGVYFAVNELTQGEWLVGLYNPGFEPWSGEVILGQGVPMVEGLLAPWGEGPQLDGTRLQLAPNTTGLLRVRRQGGS